MGFIISETRRSITHLRGRLSRRGDPAVYYFHQVDDPYSHMAEQKLEELRESAPAAERFVGVHFFNPVTRMELACNADATDL